MSERAAFVNVENLHNMISMDKHPKTVKRQQAKIIELKTDSMPTSASFSQADEAAQSVEPAELKQSIEFIKPPAPTRSWSAIDRTP